MDFKIWYLISSSFLIYSLFLLYHDRYKVNYHLIRGEVTQLADSFNLYSCYWIPEILRVKNLILKERDTAAYNTIELHSETNVIVSEFLRETYALLKAVFDESLRKRKNSSEIGNYKFPLQKDGSSIYINHICYRLDQQLLSNLEFLDRFNQKIFSNRISQQLDRHFFHMIYLLRNVSTFNLFKISNIITQHIESYSDCVSERTIHSKTTYSKFDCINNCLKRKHRYNLYLYTEDDDGHLNLSNTAFNPAHNRECRSECSKNDCIIELFMSVLDVRFKTYNIMFVGDLATSELEFYLQVAGLTCLFLSISVNETVSMLLCLIANLVCKLGQGFRRNFCRRVSFSIKIVILLISLAGALVIGLKLVYDFHQSLIWPAISASSTFTNVNKPFSIVLCFPIQFLVNGQLGSQAEDAEILQKLTFEQLVNSTNDGYEKLVSDIYMTYGSTKRIINYFYSKKVYFRNSSYFTNDHSYGGHGEKTFFSRCFRLEIKRNEMLYQSLLTVGSLVIELRENGLDRLSTYLVHVSQEFNLKAYLFERRFKILAGISDLKETSRKANCTNKYSEESLSQNSKACRSKASCLSRCICRRYLEKHNSLPTNTLIDEDFFFDREISSIRFNSSIDSEIAEQCAEHYSKEECQGERFMSSYKMQVTYENKIEINLCFETIIIQEMDISMAKLIFALINVIGVAFGLNLIKLGRLVAAATTSLLQIRLGKYFNKKVLLAFCSLGFFGHVFVIFHGIVSDEYVRSGYFDQRKTTDLPDLTFCFTFDQSKIDSAHPLTVDYLNSLTNDVTFETMFVNFSFLNEQKEVEYLSPKQLLSCEEFATQTVFYFFNMKCFSIHPKAQTEGASYYFSEFLYPFKVQLSDQAKQNEIFFIGKKSGSKGMNELYKFQFEKGDKHLSSKFLVQIVPMIITVVDKFKYFKHPMSLLLRIIGQEQDFTGVTEYLERIEQTTKTEFGILTKSFPLSDQTTDQNYEIQEALFKQFFLQKQGPSDEYHKVYTKLNSGREIYNTHIQLSHALDDDPLADPDVEFMPSTHIQYTEFTNADSYASFVQTLLNTLALWLDVSILELHIYIRKATNGVAACARLFYRKLNLLKNKFDVFI